MNRLPIVWSLAHVSVTLAALLWVPPVAATAIDPSITPTHVTEVGLINDGETKLYFQTNAPGHFKDIYNFSVGVNNADTFAAVVEFTALSGYDIADMMIELYQGANGVGTLLGSAGLPDLQLAANLSADDYSLFVLGYTAGTSGGAYSNYLSVGVVQQAAAIPEPITLFLLLAGLFAMATATRRSGVRWR